MTDTDALKTIILEHVPGDGSTIGNIRLLRVLQSENREVSDEAYKAARDVLVAEGILGKGGGRGGSVFLIDGTADDDCEAEKDSEEDDFVDVDYVQGDEDEDFALTAPPAGSSGNARQQAERRKIRRKAGEPAQVISYRHHKDRRTNNPEVGMVKPQNDPDQPKTEWAFDPHIDPALQFDVGRAQIEALIDDALESGDEARMRDALKELKRLQEPYLNWAGKAERTNFEVDTVSLHVHERIDTANILRNVKKRMESGDGFAEAEQAEMFAPAFEHKPLREALDFYRHDKNWSNRLISGDSLLVMNSLIQKEGMSGQVQMIYIDPPYGIKYGSNFQPFLHKRKLSESDKDEDLNQEPEMIKAFRDTWELGIHSYLTYLRDRCLLAFDLLRDSGSIFIQISDENVHLVRIILDEIFGSKNFVSQISFSKTGSVSGNYLGKICDIILFYAKDINKLKYRPLYIKKDDVDSEYSEDPLKSDGFRSTTTTDYEYLGKKWACAQNEHWKVTETGLNRVAKAGRMIPKRTALRLRKENSDFGYKVFHSVWLGFGGASGMRYIVETNPRIVERCLLMTTDPGDLVIDPTCGSGTTALVSEKWGRRWISCDTSRVAVTLAKQRLMTAVFEYFALRYQQEGLKGGFDYQTVPHVTLGSIANNPDIDKIYERLHPAIETALADLNAALKGTEVRMKSPQGGRKGQWIDFAAKKGKNTILPTGEAVSLNAMLEWEVPIDFPDDWPETARTPFDAFHGACQAMQQRMDESITAHAEPETLYDQPKPDSNRLRITGPFTLEAVPGPTVVGLADTRPPDEADAAVARSGETSRQTMWRNELMKTGIRGKGGQMTRIADLEAIPSSKYLHASGSLAETGERVVVSFGPEHAALEQRQVELALSEAEKLRPAPKFVVFCAFTFDPEAAKDIDEAVWPGVTLLKAQMNTDLLTEDLKRARSNNQSFWLMGQPDVETRRRKDGKWEVEVHGFDYFDPTKGELVSGGKSKIAMWSLDTDYDERSLYPHQVFFPMAGQKDGWHRLRKTIRAELDEDLLDQFHGTVSLPFEAGDNSRIAVKIVDDRGIESLKIVQLEK